jgi:hypothetical protein
VCAAQDIKIALTKDGDLGTVAEKSATTQVGDGVSHKVLVS